MLTHQPLALHVLVAGEFSPYLYHLVKVVEYRTGTLFENVFKFIRRQRPFRDHAVIFVHSGYVPCRPLAISND